MSRPVVKICGFTRPDEAAAAARLGVDLVGLVFAPSRRHVTVEEARAIVKVLPAGTGTVAVFMNQPLEEITHVCRAVAPAFVQLHGTESREFCRAIGVPVIKAIVLGGEGEIPGEEHLGDAAWLLLDAGRGEGRRLDWHSLAGRPIPRPFFLAGGITPGNVAAAIALLGPDGIDCSTGVESSPGRKDIGLIRELLANIEGGDR